MAIIKNRHYGNFTQIDNGIIHSNLSDKALGALVRLLSHGENWKFNVQSFARERNVGETATRTVINELIKAGHVERVRTQTKSGRFEFTFNVYETPISNHKPEEKSPVKKDSQKIPNVDNPLAENPQVDNGSHIPYYNNKKEAIKKEPVKAEAEKVAPALPHGTHENVFLTDDEYRTLVETYGKEQTDYSIDTLSDFKYKTHKCKIKNDFNKLMKEWIKRDISWGKTPKYSACYSAQPEASQTEEDSGRSPEMTAMLLAMLNGDYSVAMGVGA